MAAEFVGYGVLVTLRSPPNAQLRGIVNNIVDHNLVLRDVTLLWSGQRIPSYTVRSHLIADLDVSPVESYEDTLLTPTASVRNNPPEIPKSPEFLDPAILSYNRQNRHNDPDRASAAQALQPVTVSPVMIADGEVPSPASKIIPPGGVSDVSSIQPQRSIRKPPQRESSATATLSEPFDALALGASPGLDNAQGKVARAQKKSRRKETQNTTTGPVVEDNLKDLANGATTIKSRGKGWRQTPLVKDASPKRPQKTRGRHSHTEDANGWATEDATDIQDMGEFDFEGNLSKFDKRQVFDDIRRDDTTAAGDRLVNINRKTRPGTDGGRNLHHTENVLDQEPGIHAGDSDDPIDVHYSSGRASRRAASVKPQISLLRHGTASPMNGSVVGGARVTLRIDKSNKPCHTLSPLQMLEIEQLSTSEFGMTEDMLAENAGRGIAEAIIKTEPGHVVFLLGNHKTGARSMVAARHLRNRRLRVTVVRLGSEREDMLLEPVRKQLAIYRKSSGYVDRWDDFQAKLSIGPPPDVIVDALLGMHLAFEELRTDDQAAALEMIRFVNRSAAKVFSIDVPSGLSAATGVITETDGNESLVVNANHVLCLGAPKVGLVNAEAPNNSSKLSVVDLGIPPAAWAKYGSRRRHGIDFGSEWIVDLKIAS